jgi:hypothetical protein
MKLWLSTVFRVVRNYALHEWDLEISLVRREEGQLCRNRRANMQRQSTRKSECAGSISLALRQFPEAFSSIPEASGEAATSVSYYATICHELE